MGTSVICGNCGQIYIAVDPSSTLCSVCADERRKDKNRKKESQICRYPGCVKVYREADQVGPNSDLCGECRQKLRIIYNQKEEAFKKVKMQEERSKLRKLEFESSEKGHEDYKVMSDFMRKYLSNKNQSMLNGILMLEKIFKSENFAGGFISGLLSGDEYFKRARQISSEILKRNIDTFESLDEMIVLRKFSENIIELLDDAYKMIKIFDRKGIHSEDYIDLKLKIMDIIYELAENDLYKRNESKIISIGNDIKRRLGKDATIKNIVTELTRTYPEFRSNYLFISRLLSNLGYKCEHTSLIEEIRKANDDLELDEFEKNMGSKTTVSIGDFDGLGGYEFEVYLEGLFKALGYTVIRTSLSGDQGADLIVSKDNEKVVVQAKMYNGKVPNKAVQEIVAAKNHYKADKAMVVTTNEFTKSAMQLALSNNVELWDGKKLRSVIKNLSN